jgi:cytochrome c5
MLFLGIQGGMGQPDAAPLSDKAVRERIQPFGQSLAVDPNAPKVERTGEQVYNEVCSGCHDSGALGSPKFKEAADWGKRIGQGYEVLLTHALKGFNKMPARGGDPDLTDLEVARGIVYMTNAAGARFEAFLKKEPEPTAADLARGKAVYADNCASCHDTGVTGAQKLTDAKAWAAPDQGRQGISLQRGHQRQLRRSGQGRQREAVRCRYPRGGGLHGGGSESGHRSGGQAAGHQASG